MYYILDFFFMLMFGIIFVAAPLGVLYLIYKSVVKKAPVESAVIFPKHFGWVTGGLVIAANLFIYELLINGNYIPSLAPGLFIASVAAALFFCLEKKKRDTLSIGLLSIATVAGLALVWRSSGLVHFANIMLAFISLCMLYGLHIYDGVKWEGLWFIRAKWYSFWSGIEHFINLGRLTFQTKTKNNRIMSVVKTVVVTTVILGVFVGLLVQADPVFADLVEEFLDEIVDRLFISGLIAILSIFALSFHVKAKKLEAKSFNILGFYDFAVPSGLLIVLFGIFLGIQAHYLFGSHADFSSFNLTYSEYVRKGFKELLTAVFFGGLLNYFIILRQKAENSEKNVNILRGLNGVLVLELFLLLGSALKRNIMYMEVYSLTRMRIVGIIILSWLALFLLTMLVVNLSKQRKEWWIFASMGLVTVLSVASLNMLNVDRIIAEATPPAGQEMDYFYIVNLSEDAGLVWPDAIKDAHSFYESIRELNTLTPDQRAILADVKLTLNSIEQKHEEWTEMKEENYGPLYFNFSRNAAQRIWEEETELFTNTLSCLQTEIIDFQITNGVYVGDEVQNRLWDYEYPLTSIRHRDYYYWEDEYSVVNSAIEEDKKTNGSLYGKYYEQVKNDEVLWEEFLNNHTPESCPL